MEVKPEENGLSWKIKVQNKETEELFSVKADLIIITGIREETPRIPSLSDKYIQTVFLTNIKSMLGSEDINVTAVSTLMLVIQSLNTRLSW